MEDTLTKARATAIKLRGSAPVLIIVPDRFTLQAEKILMRDTQCLLNVRVITFSMLYNLLSEELKTPVAGATPPLGKGELVLDKTTAVLFTWRAIQAVRTDLVYFNRSVDQYAFAEKMFNTVNQLTSCMADFKNLAKNSNNDVTKRKMQDIQTIHAKYKELTAEYTDGAGMLGWLIDNVGKSKIVKSAHIFITGFEHLSVQRAEVVRGLMQHAGEFVAGARKGSEFEQVLNQIRFEMGNQTAHVAPRETTPPSAPLLKEGEGV